MKIESIRNFLTENQIYIRAVIGIAILIAIFCPFLRVLLLLLSGIASGVNYGFNNDSIWLPETETILMPKDTKIVGKDNRKTRNLYVAQQVWVHLLCGIIGAIAFYILLSRVDRSHFFIKRIAVTDLVLTIISLLGYTGLLPSLMWFFSRKGDIKG
jgi:hypothetical protein